ARHSVAGHEPCVQSIPHASSAGPWQRGQSCVSQSPGANDRHSVGWRVGACPMDPTFFPTPADFRAWLEANHETAKELLVGFYKTSSGKPSITWPESVDQALCLGW